MKSRSFLKSLINFHYKFFFILSTLIIAPFTTHAFGDWIGKSIDKVAEVTLGIYITQAIVENMYGLSFLILIPILITVQLIAVYNIVKSVGETFEIANRNEKLNWMEMTFISYQSIIAFIAIIGLIAIALYMGQVMHDGISEMKTYKATKTTVEMGYK